MDQTVQALAQGWIPGWLAMLVGLVSAFVTLDMAKRIVSGPSGVGVAWLIVSAIALATGTWAVHTLNVTQLSVGITPAYQAGGLAFSWLGGAVLVAASLRLAARTDAGPVANLIGGVLLGCALLTVQVGAIMAMSLQPDVRWHPGWLALGALCALAAGIGAVFLQFHLAPRRANGQIVLEAVAVLVLTLGMLLGAGFALHGALLAPGANALPGAVAAHVLEPLASLGTLTLVVMMMLSSVMDSRMRRELREVKVAVANQANADPLTGLPNRESFEKQLDQRIERAELEQRRVAILHINIDGFRLLNESLGPDKADQVLRAFGQRLRGTERAGDFSGRWVGDEFVLALAGEARQMAVEQRAREMLENLSEPFDVDGREIVLTVSLGIAIFPEHGNRGTLIAHATIASRASKNAGGATYCIFEPRLMKHAREQAELLADLRNALANGELKLHYQPKVHAPSGKITAVEALLRWEHPKRGSVSPVEFVPIAERFGLISAIGRWVIEEACRQIHEWRQGGLRMRVGINLSVQQLREPDLADRIAAALEKYQVNPQLLTCEITESLAMKHSESTSLFFQKLGALGVHISIDDFGTGYSSLSHLRQLPAEELKIDRSFVLDLETSADARAVARAIVQLGLALNLKVVAEGVETEGQYQVLRDLGCDEVQGFLFGKPMPAAMLTIWAAHGDGDTPADFRASLYGETAPMPLRRE